MLKQKVVNMKKNNITKKYHLTILLDYGIEYSIWSNYENLNKIRRNIIEHKEELKNDNTKSNMLYLRYDCDCFIDVTRIILMEILDK